MNRPEAIDSAELRLPAISRAALAYYAGASGDDNPIHIDVDFARRAGKADVFAHGMLGMAYLGRLLTQLAPQSALRSFSVRFVAVTQLYNEPVLSAKVVERFAHADENRVRLQLQMANQYGQVKILGEAVLAVVMPAKAGIHGSGDLVRHGFPLSRE